MKKGNFGICLAFYGILAFALALLNQPLLCGILLGFVLLAEGDHWAVRQVLQGFMLSLVVSFFSGISYLVGSAFSMPFRFVFGWYDYDFVNAVQSVFSFVVYAGALVLSIMAILRLCRGQDANVPVLSALAYRAFGEQKPPKPAAQPVWPQQPPMQPYPPQQAPGQPVPPMQGYPMPPQPGQPVQPPMTPPVPQAAPDMHGQQASAAPVPPAPQTAPAPVQTEPQPPQQL